MPDEKLEQEMKVLYEKLKKRDEAERKRAEQEFRAAMGKDTAGTVLGLFQLTQTQIAGLQGQIDATNPLVPMMRGMAEIGARLSAIEAAFARAAEKAKEAEE